MASSIFHQKTLLLIGTILSPLSAPSLDHGNNKKNNVFQKVAVRHTRLFSVWEHQVKNDNNVNDNNYYIFIQILFVWYRFLQLTYKMDICTEYEIGQLDTIHCFVGTVLCKYSQFVSYN